MNTCTRCNGTKLEPNADGLDCQACSVPSWAKARYASSTTQNNAAFAADATSAVADGVSDYFLFSAIGDVVSAVGSGLGSVAECVGDAASATGEVACDIVGAMLD